MESSTSTSRSSAPSRRSCSDGELRRAVQADHRHLLVDELQDLTPAHVLLVRLAAGPAADVFGVGDDDQCIYGHVGADPRFLIDYRAYFPGAAEHALEVNYRCPAPVTTAAATLLSYNDVRVPKDIRTGPDVDTDPAMRSRCRPTPPTRAPGPWSTRSRVGWPSPASGLARSRC